MFDRMMSFRSGSFAALGFTALAACVPAAQAQVSAAIFFEAIVVEFSPGDAPVYVLFPYPSATGFADDANPDNRIAITSGDGSFSGEAFPATNLGSSSSVGLSSAASLSDAIANAGTWTMTVFDGVTGETDTYSFDVGTPGIPDDYLRPTSLLNAPSGSVISSNPTFEFSLDPATDPQAEYSTAYAGLYGQSGNVVSSPAIEATDRSWTPDGPLVPDSYFLFVGMWNFVGGSGLIIASEPVPEGSSPALSSFFQNVTMRSEAQSHDLISGSGSALDFEVSLDPSVISFSPLDPPIYILGLGITATGFSDESNTDNFVTIRSPDNSFSGDFYPARGTGSGTAGSVGFSSTATLSDAINSPGLWTLTATDGLTGVISEYTLSVSTPGIAPQFLRPITLDTAPGAAITTTPTFGFSLDPTADAAAEYTSAFGALFGTLPGHNYFSPQLFPSDTSWTPDGPVAEDTYTVLVLQQNPSANLFLFDVGQPEPVGPESPAASLRYDVSCSSSAQSSGLVASAFCPADFNQDGGIDGSDVEAFFMEWEAGGAAADVNQDGGIDGADVETFFAAWENGGCD